MKSIPVLNRRQLEKVFLREGRPKFSQIVEPGTRIEPPERTPPPVYGQALVSSDVVGIG